MNSEINKMARYARFATFENQKRWKLEGNKKNNQICKLWEWKKRKQEKWKKQKDLQERNLQSFKNKKKMNAASKEKETNWFRYQKLWYQLMWGWFSQYSLSRCTSV